MKTREEGQGSARTGKNVTLCGVSGCCPQVHELVDGGVEITDDGGGKVTLTAAEFAALKQASFAPA